MLSIKRLGYLLLIVVGICLVFFAWDVNATREKKMQVQEVGVEVEMPVEEMK